MLFGVNFHDISRESDFHRLVSGGFFTRLGAALVGAYPTFADASAAFLEFKNKRLGVAGDNLVSDLDLGKVLDLLASYDLYFVTVGTDENDAARGGID